MPPSCPARPRITVITPSHNHGPFIERAICSVIDQGYEQLEYLVIDAGSIDETVPLIQHYDDDIAWWHSQRHAGPGDAIHAALKHATGEWVCILPADGVMLPGVLHLVSERLARTDADWVVGHVQHIGDRDEHVGKVSTPAVASLEAFLRRDAGPLPMQASFFRRSTLAGHGRLDGRLRYAFGYDLACRLLADGVRPEVVPMLVAAQRERVASDVRRVVEEGLEWIAVAERYADFLPLEQRYAVWSGCEERRRIYALAEAESQASESRRFLWQQLLRRPWWLMSDAYRAALLQDIAHPVGDRKRRQAAA